MPTPNNRNTKKERILNTALSLFSKRGYHATTTKEIAAECGVAEGLIFYHFGDKRKLLLHIVRHFSFIQLVHEDVKELAKLSTDEALVRYGLTYLQFLRDHADYIMLIWSPELVLDEEVSSEVSQLIGGFGAAGSSILKQSPGSASHHAFTIEIAMMMITSSILVYFMLHSRFGHGNLPIDDESYIRELVRLLMHGWNEQPQPE